MAKMKECNKNAAFLCHKINKSFLKQNLFIRNQFKTQIK
jgi:hypothetical protein